MTKTLAQIIIYGSDNDVQQFLSTDPKINEIDEYGYTPLIQCVIVNSVSKTKMLLNANADIEFPDLTGRTALHWASSNCNYELCKLLLEHQANPNSYTYAGQPALVIPYLKQDKKLYNLLFEYGADLNFALDFINAKTLGHRFELEGRVDIVDTQNTFTEVEFEGFYLEFSLNLVASSIQDFRKNIGSKHLRNYFAKMDSIIRSLDNAIELMKYQHYLIDVNKYKQNIDELLHMQPLILPLAFDGHAVTFIRFFDWLIRCDRGEFGRKNGTVIVYFMQHPEHLTNELIRALLYRRQSTDTINQQLQGILGLNVAWKIPLSPQTTGNCTWANVEAVLPALMFLFILEEHKGKDPERCQTEAFKIYDNWVAWDKNRSIHFCVNTFYDANKARQASKVALLGAIMCQTCQYDKQEDQERVEKILPILILPKYRYVLDAYLEVLSQNPNSPLKANLLNFLDDYGVK